MTVTDRLLGARSSLAYKAPCKVATTANITLSGTQTIDDVAVVADDRVLVKDQTNAAENGIYEVRADAWVRAADFAHTRDVTQGTRVNVVQGTASQGDWEVTTTGIIAVGTTNIVFALVSGGGGGGGVTVVGTPADGQLSVWTSSTSIEGTSNLTYDGTELQVGGSSLPTTTPTSDEGGVAYFDSYGGPPYTLNANSNFIYVPDFAGVQITNEPLTITGNARKALNLQADGGEVFNIMFETESGSNRWALRKTNDAETGSNAGSDFGIYNHSDAGAEIGHVFYAERDTGTVYIGGSSGLGPDASADNFVVTSRSGNAGMTIMSPDNLADSYLYFGYFGDSNMAGFIHDSGQNTLSVRVDDVTRYVFGTNGFKVREATAADADTTGFGQFWVKNDTPNTPMFTDDSGNDYELATTTGGGAWINIELDFSNNTITGTKAEFDTALSDANFVFDDEPIPTPGYIVSTLPTPATGMVAHVTDADSPSIGSTVVGGGAAYALVTYNGSNWTVIGV